MRTSAQALVSEIAARQHGVVTRAQLLDRGLSSDTVDRGVKAKFLQRVHRGVYRVGVSRGVYEREMAAVLACGAGAALSYRSAAVVRRLLIGQDPGTPVDVSIERRNGGRRPGIRLHRVRHLPAEDVADFQGIPITSVPRTLIDLAGVVSSRELEQALARAERQRLTNRSELLVRLGGWSGRGAAQLRALLEMEEALKMTRSIAEDIALDLIRMAELPEPEANADVMGVEVDYFWPANRLVLEIDGFAYHADRSTFESDRRRDARFSAKGIQVVRVTWRELQQYPMAVVARLAQALVVGSVR